MPPSVGQGEVAVAQDALKTPADILALLILLMVVLLAYRYTVAVIIPQAQARLKKNGNGTGTASQPGWIDAWLTITRDLVEQIRRSVDNQVATNNRIADLTTSLTAEIQGSETRVIQAVQRAAGPPSAGHDGP